MEGLLKKELVIGDKKPYYIAESGKWVQIIDRQEHPIFGTRYKIFGRHEWFEENCFEEIKTE